jgi:hypothetical protein
MKDQQPSIQMGSAVDPYLYQLLMKAVGKNVVVQTTKNPLQGLLKKVFPDYVVIEVSKTPFYVRNQEIIWVSLS